MNGSALRDARPRRPDQWGQGGVGSSFQFSVNVNEWLDGQEVYLSFDGPAPLSLESCWDAEIVCQGRGAAVRRSSRSGWRQRRRRAVRPSAAADGVFREPQIRRARGRRPTASAMALGYAGHHEFELKIHLDRWAADVPVELELRSVPARAPTPP